jgi:hypothetical protein
LAGVQKRSPIEGFTPPKLSFYDDGVGDGDGSIDSVGKPEVPLMDVWFRMLLCISLIIFICGLDPLKVCCTISTEYTTATQDKTTVAVTNSSAATVASI